MEDIKQVVEVLSSHGFGCPYCDFKDSGDWEIGSRVNHLLGHGLVLLHVGQQTDWGRDDTAWQTTVAVLGEKG